MASHVLFTWDERSFKNKTSEKDGLLYTRIAVSEKIKINNANDPLLQHLKHETISNHGNTHFKGLTYRLDILSINEVNFEQYSSTITEGNLEKINNNGLLKDMGIDNLYLWVYGLLVEGTYNNEKLYRFELLETLGELNWTIKYLYEGLFRAVLSVRLDKCGDVNMDEYFLEDLQELYRKDLLNQQKERIWNSERRHLMEQIHLLESRTEIDKLREDVRNMRKLQLAYFIPLINEYNNEIRQLKRQLDSNSDSLFINSRKRCTTSNTSLSKDVEVVDEKKSSSDFDGNDQIFLRDRDKRMKIISVKDKHTQQAFEGGECGVITIKDEEYSRRDNRSPKYNTTSRKRIVSHDSNRSSTAPQQSISMEVAETQRDSPEEPLPSFAVQNVIVLDSLTQPNAQLNERSVFSDKELSSSKQSLKTAATVVSDDEGTDISTDDSTDISE